MGAEVRIRKNMGPAAANPFWEWDNTSELHMTFRVQLDHEVDSDLLLEALTETYEVWPVLKDVYIETPDGNLCIAETDKPIKVHHSELAVSPGRGRNEDRMCAVSYFGDTVTFTGMHAFFDGGSVFLIIKDSIARYLRKYYGDDLGTGGELKKKGEGDRPEYCMFYLQNPNVAAMPFQMREPVEEIDEVFDDPRMTYGPNKTLSRYVIECPNDEFLAYCKKNATNPSVMMFILFAQAAYNLNPTTNLPVTANNTMNIRHALNLDNAIMGQTMGARLAMTREDMELPLPELGKKIKDSFNRQRELDFILSRIDDMKKGIPSLAYPISISLHYMGRIDLGDATKHIKRFGMYGDLEKNIMACELNGVFSMSLLFGQASKEYAEEICRLLNAAGISATNVERTDVLPHEIR